MSTTNSNMSEAVRGILKSADNGVSFVALVRTLREKGFEPSLDEVQKALVDGCDEQDLFLFDGKLVLNPDDLPDTYPLFYVVEPEDDIEQMMEAPTPLGCDIQTLFSNEMVAVATTPEHAYHDAITDWTGEGRARMIYRADAPDATAELLWVQLGAATLRQPTMPPAEPKPREVTLQDYVNAEMVAIEDAVHGALDEDIYKQLRAEANKEGEKLSLSIKVDVDTYRHVVNAQMSGAIKLKASHQTLIEDPAQMKLNL